MHKLMQLLNLVILANSIRNTLLYLLCAFCSYSPSNFLKAFQLLKISSNLRKFQRNRWPFPIGIDIVELIFKFKRLWRVIESFINSFHYKRFTLLLYGGLVESPEEFTHIIVALGTLTYKSAATSNQWHDVSYFFSQNYNKSLLQKESRIFSTLLI